MRTELLGQILLVGFTAGLFYLLLWLYIVPLVSILTPLFPAQLWSLTLPTIAFVTLTLTLGSFATYLFAEEHLKAA